MMDAYALHYSKDLCFEVRNMIATLTSKGQITIPKMVRQALNLDAGDRVSFRVRPDGIVEMEPQNTHLMSLCGVIKPSKKGVSLEQMQKAVSKRATKRHKSGITR